MRRWRCLVLRETEDRPVTGSCLTRFVRRESHECSEFSVTYGAQLMMPQGGLQSSRNSENRNRRISLTASLGSDSF